MFEFFDGEVPKFSVPNTQRSGELFTQTKTKVPSISESEPDVTRFRAPTEPKNSQLKIPASDLKDPVRHIFQVDSYRIRFTHEITHIYFSAHIALFILRASELIIRLPGPRQLHDTWVA